MKNNILVIEDDRATCDLLSVILEHAGYQVKTCRNGLNGIEAFKTGEFDLILTDLFMPGLSGFEVIAHIRQKNLSVPIIVLSGADRLKDSHDREFPHFLVRKPFHINHVVETVKKALDANS